MRRTSRPRCIHSGSGWRRSVRCRRTGGSSPTTEDRSTGTRLDRPGLQAALDLARRGGADLLLVYRVDRLSRKVRQLAQLAEELDGLDVVLKSATEPFDTGSAAGRMMLQMLGVFAEFEYATIVDRITAGIERRAKQGHWPNGRVLVRLHPHQRQAPGPRRARGADRQDGSSTSTPPAGSDPCRSRGSSRPRACRRAGERGCRRRC